MAGSGELEDLGGEGLVGAMGPVGAMEPSPCGGCIKCVLIRL